MITKYMKTKVAGVTFENHQENIKVLKETKGVYFELVRDRNNEYDNLAVKVIARTLDGKIYDIGFIPKKSNKDIANALDNNKTCFIKRYGYTGGYNNYASYGVQLEIIYEI